ncbi:YgaP family membrane protein [Nocardia pseudovaccinii]|uniref:YgaP family membrane protein n=1 Tax=Nocardia pseudovaccinii TaxID=189540 RepID=UPI003D93261B
MTNLPRHQGWSIARVVPLLAGTFIVISVALAAVWSAWWLVFTGLVGANLLLYGVAGWCPMTLLLRRLGLPATAGCAVTRTRPPTAAPIIVDRKYG